MSKQPIESDNNSNTIVNFSVSNNQTFVYSNIPYILNCVGFLFALVGVVFGCFVINIVRKLDDDELRSRFSLLCVLLCDVILSVSNLSNVIYLLLLIDEKLFQFLKCPFDYATWVLTGLFSISLVLSLFCLAVDQVIAVFKPLYFKTSEVTRRKVTYGLVTSIPVIFASVLLMYRYFQVVNSSHDRMNCIALMKANDDLSPYLVVILISLAVSTPVIYAVVLWKISRQRCVHSENPLENIQNRRLVVSFLLLSASYFLLWMPTLAYFSVCYYSGDGCWQEDTSNVSIIVHIIFTCNYIVDPITCAVRMEPIKQKVIQAFRHFWR